MAASLGHDDAQDRAAAAWTGPAGAAKDVECFRVSARPAARQVKIALAGAQRRAQVFQPFVQDMGNGPVQVPNLMNGERTAGALRVNPGLPEGFIDVYIAQAGQKMLVQQQRFDLAIRLLQHRRKPFDREGFFQRFGAQAAQNLLWRRGQPDTTKLACVLKTQAMRLANAKITCSCLLRGASAGSQLSRPVMRRWIIKVRPPDRSNKIYFPRRPIRRIVRPLIVLQKSAGSGSAMVLGQYTAAPEIRRPAMFFPRRASTTHWTSGSSGMAAIGSGENGSLRCVNPMLHKQY